MIASAPHLAASSARRSAPALLVSATPITTGMRPATTSTARFMPSIRSCVASTVNSLAITGQT